MAQNTALSGNLGFMGLADLFQIIGGNSRSGILRLTTPFAPDVGEIYFVKGNPVSASNGRLKGVDAIYPLFGWTDGRFDFEEKEVQVDRTVKQGRMQIVLDALRMVDDGQIQKVGPPSLDVEIVAGEGEKGLPKLMKGPMLDYSYVIGEEEFRSGERIIKEGGHGKWIWLILEGNVRVNRTGPKGPVTIARMGEGCFVGTFTSLIFKEYDRSADVVSETEVRVGLLDTDRLSRSYGSLSQPFRGLLLSLDTRLRKISEKIVELGSSPGKPPDLDKDLETFIKKGSGKEELYVIEAGEAHIVGASKKGNLHLMTLGKEDVIGNIPFLDMGHEPRSASILAPKGMKAMPLNATSLQEEYEALPGTMKNLIFNIGMSILSTTAIAYRLHEGK